MVGALYEAVGSVVTVETEDREDVRGYLVGIDKNLNLSLRVGNELVIIRGSRVSFVAIPPIIRLAYP